MAPVPVYPGSLSRHTHAPQPWRHWSLRCRGGSEGPRSTGVLAVPVPSGCRCPRGASHGILAHRNLGELQRRWLWGPHGTGSLSKHTGAPSSVGSGLPVRPAGPRPVAHPERMVPARCRRFGSARLGGARLHSALLGSARGAGREAGEGGRQGRPAPGCLRSGRAGAGPQPPPKSRSPGLEPALSSCSRVGNTPRGVQALRQPQCSQCAGHMARMPSRRSIPPARREAPQKGTVRHPKRAP